MTVSHDEWVRHTRRVELIAETMAGLMLALGQNPMFSGFVPPDVRAKLAELA